MLRPFFFAFLWYIAELSPFRKSHRLAFIVLIFFQNLASSFVRISETPLYRREIIGPPFGAFSIDARILGEYAELSLYSLEPSFG